MCGIVGYLGSQSPKEVIVGGLKKLEYRGYDSAGIAVLQDGKTVRVRAEGKLKSLEDKLAAMPLTSHVGIGHTRWATHGPPSERNAHPHHVGGISLVHNGIIENYLEIREDLSRRGAELTSDTDSELVAHLLNEEVLREKALLPAVMKVLKRIRGAFSIVAMWEGDASTLVAFKDGPPLVVGIGKGENFVASDVQACLQHTKNFVYLEDREIVEVKADGVRFFTQDGNVLEKKPVHLDWNPEMVEKQGFSHYMLKEIYEQSRAVASALAPHIDTRTMTARLSRVGFGASPNDLEKLDVENDAQNTAQKLKDIERIFIVACGTSNYAAMVGKYYIENLARIPVETDVASEFRYRKPVIPPRSLVMTISQSGETADTLAALRLAKEKGALTLSLCNVRNSSIDREAHGHLYMNSGPEIGVASTKAFTSTLSVLACAAAALGRIKGALADAEEKEIVQALLAVPAQMEVVLAYDKYFDEAAAKLKLFKGFLYLGRGVSFPIALEGALKLKELAYFHAEGYAAGEMKHGPLALIDERMAVVTVLPDDDVFEKTMSNLEETRARGGRIVCLGPANNEKLREMCDYFLPLPKAHWMTNPILSVVPLQLMAFHLAASLGYDVDQPRNLAKSVTVE